MHTRPSRIDALESRRLLASSIATTAATLTGSDYQSVDAVTAIPGGYVMAGTFGENTNFGPGLPKVAPRGATDLFIRVVKGSSTSLLTLGGGEGDDGKIRFKDDRADYAGAPERVEDNEFFFPVNGRAARVDEYVTSVKLGPDGKLYVAIAFRREISLNTQDKKAKTLTPQKEFEDNLFDSAVLRYTINGTKLTLDRTLQIGGPFNDIIYDIDFASDDGDLLVAGSFERRADFQPGKGSYILNPAGRGDGFVARYGSKDKLEWVRQFGGDESGGLELEAAYGIAVSGKKIYVGGAFAEDAEFDRRDKLDEDGQDDDGEENVRLEANDGTDGFTLKLDAKKGDFEWVVGQGGDDYDAVKDVAIAPDGGVYNLGYFQNEADLDADPKAEQIVEAADDGDVIDGRGEDTDLFFTRLNADGEQVWVKPLIGEGRPLIGSLSSTASGDLTVVGSFAGNVDVDPAKRKRLFRSPAADINDRNGNRDNAYAGMVAVYRANGTLRRAVQVNGQRQQDLFLNDASRSSTTGELVLGGRYLGGVEVIGQDFRVTTQKKPQGREDGFAFLLDDELV